MSKILLVEDETVLADTLLLSMQKLGFQCIWVKTLKEARSELKKNKFDLMVLDRNLPDGDGIELLRSPERKKILTLVLSAKAALSDRVKGLTEGADDYLPKPFSFQELAARLQALERRIPERENGAAEIPELKKITLWSLNVDTQSIFTAQGWMELTPLEFKFLSYLVVREGSIVSKDRLLRDVWGFSFLPKTRTVDYLVTQLRKRIEPNPEVPVHLLTIRGAGIKFVK